VTDSISSALLAMSVPKEAMRIRNQIHAISRDIRGGKHRKPVIGLNDSVRVGLQDLPFGVLTEFAHDNYTRATTPTRPYFK
jgi:hypothetical protein